VVKTEHTKNTKAITKLVLHYGILLKCLSKVKDNSLNFLTESIQNQHLFTKRLLLKILVNLCCNTSISTTRINYYFKNVPQGRTNFDYMLNTV